jgi:hypothetical protein
MCRIEEQVGGSAITWTIQEQWAVDAEARLGFTGNDLSKCFRITMERLNADGMNAEALLIEKHRVRRELQHYDSNFVYAYSRLPSQQDKLPMKGLYRYYSHLKTCLAKTMQQQTLDVFENAFSAPVLEPPPGLTLPPGLSLPVRNIQGLFPPGLNLPVSPPPGLGSPSDRRESLSLQPNLSATNASPKSKVAPAPAACKQVFDVQSLDVVKADSSEENRAPAASSTIIDWCIDNVSQKLSASRGAPVTSDVFEIGGMPELRLIFVPGQTWLANKPNSKRLRNHLGNMPKHGSLKLKCMSSELPGSFHFFLSVGSCPLGRFEYDFAEKNVQECLFSVDWFEQFDQEADRLEFRLYFC